MQELDSVARELLSLGFAADAVPILSEAVSVAEAIDPNSPLPAAFAGDVIQSPEQIRQHLNAAIQGMNPTELAPLAGRLIAEANEVPPMNKDASRPKPAKGRDQALDLVLMIYPRELDKAALRSLLAESLAACDAEQLAALDLPLESLRKAHPDDLSVAIATALRALAGDDPKRTDSALVRLLQLLEETPLEPLRSGARPNARERALAARLIPLWPVARACWKQSSTTLHALGDRLAVRALEGASRQSDHRWMLAMLREQGQLAFDHSDQAAAKATWSRMLNIVVAPEPAKSQNSRPNHRPAPRGSRTPASRPAPPAPAGAKTPAPTTTPTSGSHTGPWKSRSYAACALAAIMCCASSSACEAGLRESEPAGEPIASPARAEPPPSRIRSHPTWVVRLAAYQQPATKRRADPPAAGAAADPAAVEEAARAARHGAIPVAHREKPKTRHRAGPRLRLPRGTGLA